VHKLGMKKNFQSFHFQWHKLDMYMTVSEIIFLFWIPFIQTPSIGSQNSVKQPKFTHDMPQSSLSLWKRHSVQYSCVKMSTQAAH
jgi:hypothetical protein